MLPIMDNEFGRSACGEVRIPPGLRDVHDLWYPRRNMLFLKTELEKKTSTLVFKLFLDKQGPGFFRGLCSALKNVCRKN